MRRQHAIFIFLTLSLLTFFSAGCSFEGRDETEAQAEKKSAQKASVTLTFNGGPTGGTFNYFANKMSSLITDETGWLKPLAKGSGGSLDNICALNTDQADMGIAYAGDAFLGRNGRLDCEEATLDRVRTMAYLYGAPAQLVVRRDSGIDSVYDLHERTIAVGNHGSGAALSAERFFKHLRLWDSMDYRHQGYSQAAADFVAGEVDGFWVLVGYPNASIIEAAMNVPIKLLDLHQAGAASGFYDLYPFYTIAEIPADTYKGQSDPVATFQDAAMWCVREGLEDDVVYDSLNAVFTAKGIEGMNKAHKAARELSIKDGLKNLSVPLHPGAIRFWTDQGLDIPAILLP